MGTGTSRRQTIPQLPKSKLTSYLEYNVSLIANYSTYSTLIQMAWPRASHFKTTSIDWVHSTPKWGGEMTTGGYIPWSRNSSITKRRGKAQPSSPYDQGDMSHVPLILPEIQKSNEQSINQITRNPESKAADRELTSRKGEIFHRLRPINEVEAKMKSRRQKTLTFTEMKVGQRDCETKAAKDK